MKILESQNAVLSNYEVYQHLVDHQKTTKSQQRRGPGNLATLIKEVCFTFFIVTTSTQPLLALVYIYKVTSAS